MIYLKNLVKWVFLTYLVKPSNILNKHAPMKKRYIRANNSPFMTNTIYKAIMLRSKLQNKSRRLKTIEFREAYKRQRNICVSLIRDAKKNFYENLIPKLITDNRKFLDRLSLFSRTKHQSAITSFLQKKMKLLMTIQHVQKYSTIVSVTS